MSTQKRIDSVEDVYKYNLCTMCGTCAGACPKSAITMARDPRKGLYRPKINKEKCDNCGFCLEVCPGHEVDFKSLNLRIFGKQPETPFLGNWKGMYVVYAADEEMRYRGSSGGAVSALLTHAFAAGLLDGALVSRMSRLRPLEPEVFIAREKNDVLEAAGSKYCPVPTNAALSKLIGTEKKYALVGLPCHIHGVRKLMTKRRKVEETITMTLGLMCSNTASFFATEYMLRRKGVDPARVSSFAFRKGGWLPKSLLHVTTTDGKERVLYDRIPLSFKDQALHNATYHQNFVPIRCLSCPDHTNEIADIAFGDPRGREFKKGDEAGKSLIIVRTKRGEGLFKDAVKKGRITIVKELDIRGFLENQNLEKKTKVSSRISALKKLSMPVPSFNPHPAGTENDRLNLVDYVWSFYSHHRFLWPLLAPYSISKAFMHHARLKLAQLFPTVHS